MGQVLVRTLQHTPVKITDQGHRLERLGQVSRGIGFHPLASRDEHVDDFIDWSVEGRTRIGALPDQRVDIERRGSEGAVAGIAASNDLTFDEMVLLDIYYVENWSLALDLGILLRSLPAVIWGRGAY